jgi:hypothetical protein
MIQLLTRRGTRFVFGADFAFRMIKMIHNLYLTGVLLAAVALYLLPALIADDRKRADTLALALFNFAFGWTVVGWVMALRWALQPVSQADVARLVVMTRREKTEALFAAIATRAQRRDAAQGANRATKTI